MSLGGTCKRRSPNLVAAGPEEFEFELAGRPPSSPSVLEPDGAETVLIPLPDSAQ